MLVIFDWDGTLIDSIGKIIMCMQQAAADAGVEPRDGEAIRNIIGLGLGEALMVLYSEQEPALRADIRRHYATRFVAADQTPCDFFPGVRDTLDTLRSSGLLLAVATGKSRRGLDRVLGNLNMGGYFQGSRCADETASKPDPLMLNQLCEEFNVLPEDSVLVGDTEYDLEMASRIGMPSVGVSYGAHSVERLANWGPLKILDEFRALLPLLSGRYGMAIPR
ncbi:MAG: phosphoglycolate phosphatase [Bermanella sp.]